MVDESHVELGIPGLGPAVRIGSGGFADVYRATQTNLRREVAVKVLRAAANDAPARMRFERECHAVGAVSGHQNIVGVHEGGFTSDGRAYLVMEYCPGGSLRDRIDRDGAMPAAEVIEIGQKIGRALGVAHDAGVLHRDVKPANILITAYGEPALADFGIARVEGGQQTATGLVTASLAHAAPEVLGGEGPTASSDIYSLGSTLFELAVGRAPHYRDDEQSVWALMNRVISEPVPDPASLGVPDPLAATIRTATANQPTERFATSTALVTALSDQAGAHRSAPAATPTAGPPAVQPAASQPTPAGSAAPPDQALTATMGGGHEQPTATMHPAAPHPAAQHPAAPHPAPPASAHTGEPPGGAPPTVPNREISAPPSPAPGGAGGARAHQPPADIAAAEPAGRSSTGRRWWPVAVGAALLAVIAGGAAAAVAVAGGDEPPAELVFEFPLGADGPLDAGESYELAVVGAGDNTLFRYVVDGSPVGTPRASLPPFVAEAGRHTIGIEVTQGDDVSATTPVELYVIGALPAPGYRANLSSITAEPANWPIALATFDDLLDDGHTDLRLLPSDRFATLQSGFWNLFVPGFGDDRDDGLAYCESFGLTDPNDCFVSFFDPGA